MTKVSPLQIILLVVSGFAIVIAVITFSIVKDSGGSSGVPITLWGTMDSEIFKRVVNTLVASDIDISNIIYVQKDPRNIEDDFVKALAEGAGPDLIMIDQDQIIKNEKRLLTIPYESFPLRDFLDTYIPEAELFTNNQGVIAMPLQIDPMVMYWNRNLFSKAGIATPPRTWGDVMSLTPRLTVSDSELQISESAIALGEFRNINHADDIMQNLLLQAGNTVVVRGAPNPQSQENYTVILDERLGYTIEPAIATLNFFTQFANPARDVYSWNRSLPSSLNSFLAGDLAMYLGFASEINTIRAQNPNLDFDITTMPQSQNSNERKVFANMKAVAISRNSVNVVSAFNAALILGGPAFQEVLSRETGLPPVRREMLQADPSNRFDTILYTSALWSHGILEIERDQTAVILQSMVESFVTGRFSSSQAVTRAREEMEILLNN